MEAPRLTLRAELTPNSRSTNVLLKSLRMLDSCRRIHSKSQGAGGTEEGQTGVVLRQSRDTSTEPRDLEKWELSFLDDLTPAAQCSLHRGRYLELASELSTIRIVVALLLQLAKQRVMPNIPTVDRVLTS